MVFGWGKKKQEEKPVEEIPQFKQVSLVDVPKIIADLNNVRLSQTVSEIKHIRNSTEPLVQELIKIGNVLDNDDLKVDDIDKHLAIIVVRGKKQVIDVIKKDVRSLPEIKTIEDSVKLNNFLNQLLKKVGDVLGRQTRVIHIFAKKYAQQLKENLEVMTSNHGEIQNILKNYNSTTLLSNEILSALSEIKRLKEAQNEKNQKIQETQSAIENTTNKIKMLEESVDKLKTSEQFKKYLELKSELDFFSTQKNKLKNEVDNQFTKISRPLSRYEYGSSLDKDQKNILSLLVENPFDALTSSNKDAIIVILENVRKGITSGSISVKDVEKASSQITETEEYLDKFIQMVSEFLKKHSELEDELASVYPKELESLEHDLNKNSSSKSDLELKSETFQGEIDEIDTKIPELISQIETNLREFSNTKYSIVSN